MMARKLLPLLIIVLCFSGCGKPSAVEMRDRLGKMTVEQATASSREELISRIGLEPDEIETSYGCEVWIYKLSGGDVRLSVCEVDGQHIAQVREFGRPGN